MIKRLRICVHPLDSHAAALYLKTNGLFAEWIWPLRIGDWTFGFNHPHAQLAFCPVFLNKMDLWKTEIGFNRNFPWRVEASSKRWLKFNFSNGIWSSFIHLITERHWCCPLFLNTTTKTYFLSSLFTFQFRFTIFFSSIIGIAVV